MKKRLLSVLLVLCMVISLLPMSVLAVEATPDAVVYRDPVKDYASGTESNPVGMVRPETLAAWEAAIYAAAGEVGEIEYELEGQYIPLGVVTVGPISKDLTVGFGVKAVYREIKTTDYSKFAPKSSDVNVRVNDKEIVVRVQNYVDITWIVGGVAKTEKVVYGATPVYTGADAADVAYWTNTADELVVIAPATADATYIGVIPAPEEPAIENVTVETAITVANDDVTVPAGTTKDELLAKVGASLNVEGAIVVDTDVAALAAGTYDVTLSYAGKVEKVGNVVTTTTPAQATVKVTIEKPAKLDGATVAVDNATVKYGTKVNPADLIKSEYKTIDVVGGVDAKSAKNLAGVVYVDLTKSTGLTPAQIASAAGISDANNVTIEQLKDLLDQFGSDLTINPASIDKALNAVDTVRALLKSKLGVNSTVTIKLVDALPELENVGIYLVASAVSDPAYNTELGAGYVIIYPDGEKVTLSWNYNDPNYVVALDNASSIDLGATASIPEAQKNVETLFIGIDQNKDLHVGRTMPADIYPGVYVEVAAILDWGNEMYYSEPIVRPVVVAPNAAEVKFVDENGAANNIREYVYDGSAKALNVTVDGVANPEAGELKVRYIGIDGHASLKGMNLTTELSNIYDGPDAAAAPTEAGIYLVVAVYADKDDSTGKLIKAGGNAAVLVIRPAKPDFALEDTFKVYDGNEYFSDMTNPLGMDHVKIAVDRDSNEVFVELPADYEQFVKMLPAELETEVMNFIAGWEADPLTVEFIQATATSLINDVLIPADLTGKLMTELNNLADAVSAKISAGISVYGEKAENYVESKATAKLKAELKAKLSGKVSDATIDEYVDLLTKAIEFDGSTVSAADRNAVIAKTQAASKALITKYAGSEVDGLVQGKIDSVIDEVVTAVYTHEEIGIDRLVNIVNYAIARLSALEVDDAEKVVKLSLAVASKVIDVDEVLDAVEVLVSKVIEAGYVDYLDTMVRGLDAIYDVEIDGLKNAVLGLKPLVSSLVNKMTTKEGDITVADIQALEKQLDEEILPELLAIIMAMPADGKIYLNKMPSEEGTYDTFAINFAANYAPVIAEAELVIGIEGMEICEHKWSDWTIVKEADCENAGSKTRTCELCKATQTEVIPALGHDYVATVTEPTCTEDGYTTYKCSRCDASYTADKVAALGHDWGEWIVTKEPQVGIDGEETRTCKRCGETETRPIPALDPDDPDEPSDDKHRCWGPCCNMNFDDVKPHHWFYNDVHYVFCTGLMKGISKNLFGPDMTTTRGMIVTILYRMEKEPTVKTDCPFEDVAADMYYEDPITWAAANGIVYGYNEKSFGPEDYITREQMAAILFRYAAYKGYDTTDRADLSMFSDSAKISAYAVDAMSWAVAEGLINGMGDGTVAPQGNALRAQAAALLHRYCVKVAGMPEKYKTEGCRHYR